MERYTARRGPARRPKREETILETRDIFVLKLDNDELEYWVELVAMVDVVNIEKFTKGEAV